MNTPERPSDDLRLPEPGVDTVVAQRHRGRNWSVALAAFLLFTVGGVWLSARGQQPAPGPQPAFGSLGASPPNFVFNTPTTVTFTILVDTPTLNPTTVQLQRVDADGRVLAAIGRMFDNGQEGDVRPGDRVFTKRVALNEPAAGKAYFRVAAAFRGNQQNAVSGLIAIDIWQRLQMVDLGFAVDVPSQFVTVRSEGDANKLGFYIGQDVLGKRAAPVLIIAVAALPSTQTLRDFALSLGGNPSSIRETSFGPTRYLKWQEDLGDGMVTTFYSAVLSPRKVITISTVSPAFAASDDLVAILTSLTF